MAMSTFSKQFSAAAQTKKRVAVIDLLRRSPKTSLEQLGKLIGEHGKLLGSIKLSDILVVEEPKAQVPPKKKSKVVKSSKSVAKAPRGPGADDVLAPRRFQGARHGLVGNRHRGDGQQAEAEVLRVVNTRTPEQRQAYDRKVFDTLRQLGANQGAPEIAKVAGGTPLQVRTALARLIELGKVTWSGKARGTMYSLT